MHPALEKPYEQLTPDNCSMEQIKVGDASSSILIAGTGEAVVLIPSWARGADDFTDLMKVLVPLRGSKKSKVRSKKYYVIRLSNFLNGCFIYAVLY